MMIDTHCHVQFRAFKDDFDQVINRCLEKGMILNLVGTQKDTSQWAVELANKYENVYASIGTHPIHLHPTHVDEEETHFMSREEGFDWEFYENLAKSNKVIGIGECGLELFHLPADKTREEVLAKQKQVFLDHVRFSLVQDLPMVIHCREAHDEMIELLRELPKKPRATIHCYTSNWRHAEQYLEMGFYLGFTGVITFPAKKTNPLAQEQLLEVVQKMPLDRIVVETDSPYLAPQAYRGQRAEPWMVEEVIKKIALVREKNFAEISEIIANNTLSLFNRIKKS